MLDKLRDFLLAEPGAARREPLDMENGSRAAPPRAAAQRCRATLFRHTVQVQSAPALHKSSQSALQSAAESSGVTGGQNRLRDNTRDDVDRDVALSSIVCARNRATVDGEIDADVDDNDLLWGDYDPRVGANQVVLLQLAVHIESADDTSDDWSPNSAFVTFLSSTLVPRQSLAVTLGDDSAVRASCAARDANGNAANEKDFVCYNNDCPRVRGWCHNERCGARPHTAYLFFSPVELAELAQLAPEIGAERGTHTHVLGTQSEDAREDAVVEVSGKSSLVPNAHRDVRNVALVSREQYTRALDEASDSVLHNLPLASLSNSYVHVRARDNGARRRSLRLVFVAQCVEFAS